MVIGILSDTHGRVDRTAAAIELLRKHGAEAFIHCGDIGSIEVLEQFAGLCAYLVWGNMDDVSPTTAASLRASGLPAPARGPLRLALSGRQVAVFHGHEREFEKLTRLAQAGRLDELYQAAGAECVLFGHTHRGFDQHFGPVHFVNPGAVSRASPCTVATLDLQSDVVRFLPLDQQL